MNEISTHGRRKLWQRVLLMLLMALAFQLASTVLGLLAVVQSVLALLTDEPNPRLSDFGHRLGQYLRQIADFVSFATEEPPLSFQRLAGPGRVRYAPWPVDTATGQSVTVQAGSTRRPGPRAQVSFELHDGSAATTRTAPSQAGPAGTATLPALGC